MKEYERENFLLKVSVEYATNLVIARYSGFNGRRKFTEKLYRNDVKAAHISGVLSLVEHVIVTDDTKPYEDIDAIFHDFNNALDSYKKELPLKVYELAIKRIKDNNPSDFELSRLSSLHSREKAKFNFTQHPSKKIKELIFFDDMRYAHVSGIITSIYTAFIKHKLNPYIDKEELIGDLQILTIGCWNEYAEKLSNGKHSKTTLDDFLKTGGLVDVRR